MPTEEEGYPMVGIALVMLFAVGVALFAAAKSEDPPKPQPVQHIRYCFWPNGLATPCEWNTWEQRHA